MLALSLQDNLYNLSLHPLSDNVKISYSGLSLCVKGRHEQ